jgi:hypothetical protein
MFFSISSKPKLDEEGRITLPEFRKISRGCLNRWRLINSLSDEDVATDYLGAFLENKSTALILSEPISEKALEFLEVHCGVGSVVLNEDFLWIFSISATICLTGSTDPIIGEAEYFGLNKRGRECRTKDVPAKLREKIVTLLEKNS